MYLANQASSLLAVSPGVVRLPIYVGVHRVFELSNLLYGRVLDTFEECRSLIIKEKCSIFNLESHCSFLCYQSVIVALSEV